MLVLNRKVSEKIQIGDDITIVVSRVSGDRVSLGIDAPRDVRILRGELKDSSAGSDAQALSKSKLDISSLLDTESAIGS